MTYNQRVKNTLILKSKKNCCKKSEFYAYLFFNNAFTEDEIIISETDKEIFYFFLSQAEAIVRHPLPVSKNGRVYYCIITEKDARILNAKFSVIRANGTESLENMGNECCRKAFLRGLFISRGVVSDPQKRYALEFNLKSEELARWCAGYIIELGYDPGVVKRNDNYVVYVKNAESIKDFLTMIGAVEFLFDYTNAEIYKEFQNKINRIVNCENANIDKAVRVMTEQRAAIRRLKEKGYDGLSPDLILIAEKRLNSESASLEALGKEFDPPISKSTLFRKLKKICDMANEKEKGAE